MNARTRKKAEAHALAVKYLGAARVTRIKLQHPTRWPAVAMEDVQRVIRAEQARRAR